MELNKQSQLSSNSPMLAVNLRKTNQIGAPESSACTVLLYRANIGLSETKLSESGVVEEWEKFQVQKEKKADACYFCCLLSTDLHCWE